MIRKQLFIVVGLVAILSCCPLDAVRIVKFSNDTDRPSISNTSLEFTLITVDGKSQKLGTFQPSIDLDQYEISKKNPVKLVVRSKNLPKNVKEQSVTSEILKPGTTYSINRRFFADLGNGSGGDALFID